MQTLKIPSLKIPLFFILIFFVTACVTINVYFPVKAAEKAADQIIDKVWGKEGQKPENESEPTIPPTKESSAPTSELLSSSHLLTHLLDFIISPAYAYNLDISSPAIQTLQDNMAKRHQELKRYYDNGAIGLTNNGLITLRNPSKVSLRKRRKVNRWIDEENQDRLSLYSQIAIANRHPEWESDIRATFTTRWIERALPGWWYQDEEGEWQRKE
ncbi:YdbL family protein [Candidatus Parabeggiatoa sp. HSG14]|uniref:YdbL family protein n=1 Tax=Candidatus Parabeggiatoa sp. HSG14 TaxID=3055593 RepID=UPI0025A8042A|nr:YdbL family protein [Thiotrichales bacterium HSG14]